MSDEQKPAEKKPQRSAAMEERLRLMREAGVTIIEGGRSIAIIGVSSGPADAAPQSADAPKPDAPAASPAVGPTGEKARRNIEESLQYLRDKGVRILNDPKDSESSPTSTGITIVGTGDQEPMPRPASEAKMPDPRPASDESGTKPKRTPEQQSFIDEVAAMNGKEWAESHAELILDQARAIGNL